MTRLKRDRVSGIEGNAKMGGGGVKHVFLRSQSYFTLKLYPTRLEKSVLVQEGKLKYINRNVSQNIKRIDK